MEIVRHRKSGVYAREVLEAPELNPFLVRVSSRQLSVSPNTLLRDTVVWAHMSQADVIRGVSRTRRFEEHGRQVVERALVLFTSHSGLQTQPRRFHRQTALLAAFGRYPLPNPD